MLLFVPTIPILIMLFVKQTAQEILIKTIKLIYVTLLALPNFTQIQLLIDVSLIVQLPTTEKQAFVSLRYWDAVPNLQITLQETALASVQQDTGATLATIPA